MMPTYDPNQTAHPQVSPLTPQPVSVQQAFAELAQRQPEAALAEQLARRLQQAAAQEQTVDQALPWQRRWVWLVMPVAAAGALAAATVVLHQVEEKEAKLHERSQALHVALGEDGAHELELDLQLDLHGEDVAQLHIDAPHGLSVRHTSAASDHAPPRCDTTHCTYAFQPVAQGKPTAQRVRIGVDKPGSYRIRARHHSQKANVQEHFDLNVRP